MVTAADILARALSLPPLDEPLALLPPGSACSITGAPIAAGYPIRPLLQKSTAVILDTIRGSLDGHLSDAAARCWKATGPGAVLMRGGLFFEDGATYQPQISLAGRESGRGCWRDVLRAVWPARRGQRTVMILTTDMKKRLWPMARVGALGASCPVLVCDADVLTPLTVDWQQLLDCLDQVEAVYARGFAKAAIRDGLLGSWQQVTAWGLSETLRLDRALDRWRRTPEFVIALLVAQREALVEPPQRPPPRTATQATRPGITQPAAPVTAPPVQGSLFDV